MSEKENTMKKISRAIDMFCYKHPRFGISNLMLCIVIGTGAMWLLSMMDTTGTLLSLLYFSPEAVLKHGQVWRILSFALMPEGNGIWELLFLYFYYIIGKTLENTWGTARFNIFVFSGMLLTVIYGFAVYLIGGTSIAVGANFIYMSMFFSIATLYPDMQVLLFFIIPIRIKWLALLNALYFIVEIVLLDFPLNLLPLIAMLNYFVFFGEGLVNELKRFKSGNRKTSREFKRKVSTIKYEQKLRSFDYKCEICGKTDVDYPDMEFRYCSKCEGYHCFCSDHINNHIHFS